MDRCYGGFASRRRCGLGPRRAGGRRPAGAVALDDAQASVDFEPLAHGLYGISARGEVDIRRLELLRDVVYAAGRHGPISAGAGRLLVLSDNSLTGPTADNGWLAAE